jgi:hypothetical protein
VRRSITNGDFDNDERLAAVFPFPTVAKNPSPKDRAEMFCFYADYDDKDCIRDVVPAKKLKLSFILSSETFVNILPKLLYSSGGKALNK